jgi:hypothetical protein
LDATVASQFRIASNGVTAATIDALGNATFAGTLAAGTFSITNNAVTTATIDSLGNATFSGTLTAAEIMTPDGPLFAGIRTIQAKIDDVQLQTLALTTDIDTIQTDLATLASPSADLAELTSRGLDLTTERINLTRPVTVADSLNVDGDVFLGNTSITGNLTVAGMVAISNRGIESLASTLSIEPRRLAKVDFLSGILMIEPDGQVAINGNLNVNGTVATDRLSPLGNNLTIDLSNSSTASAENRVFTVRSQSGSDALRVLPQGEVVVASSLTASGSATVEKLNITTSGSDTASTGRATITAGSTQIEITNKRLTENSQVYITPLSSTQGKVLYVANVNIDESCSDISCSSSFTIAIDQPAVTNDIPFNWWIIN